jgi:hypothetical protein
MLLVKPLSLGVAEQVSQDRVEEMLLEGDVCARLSIEALTAGSCRREVAAPEMFGDLVEAMPENGVIFPEGLEQVRWPSAHDR